MATLPHAPSLRARRAVLPLSLLLLGSVALAAPARADTVRLRDGRTFRDVKTHREGAGLVIELERGSLTVDLDDVFEHVRSLTAREELAERRKTAGTDPAALRATAAWARERGLTVEADRIDRDAATIAQQRDRDELVRRRVAAGRDAVALRAALAWARARGLVTEAEELDTVARGLELDAALQRLAGQKAVTPFLDLARSLEAPADRRRVLLAALERDADHPEVRRLLGEVSRDGRWMGAAESERLDREAEVRAYRARGLVEREGRWLPLEAVALLDERRALEHERRALERVSAELAAERAASERETRRLVAARADAANAERAAAAEAARLLEVQKNAAVDVARLEGAQRAAATERACLQRDADRLACERRELEAATARLAAERDALARTQRDEQSERERLESARRSLQSERERLESERRQAEDRRHHAKP